MSDFIYLLIVLSVFSIRISDNRCPKFRLIQPLDVSTGLSYAIITDKKYYIISNDDLLRNDTSIQGTNVSKEFKDMVGVMLYLNKDCSPPEYYLIAYKLVFDSENHVYDWYSTLDLNNWTKNTQLSQSYRALPEFLNKDPYMNLFDFTFSMFWIKRQNLYMVQMPSPGMPDIRDYHTIKVDSCGRHQYLVDYEKKLVEVLRPYDDFESCFIHNDRQIICFGPKGFTSYDIDLKETKEGQIRVTNVTNNFKPIPIMKIITEIRKDCEENVTETVPIPTITDSPLTNKNTEEVGSVGTTLTPSTFTDEQTEYEDMNEITQTDPTIQEMISTDFDFTTNGDMSKPRTFFWLLLLILLVIIILLIILLFWCRRKSKQKAESPIAGQQSDQGLDQMSNTSIRSQFDNKNKAKDSTIGSSHSLRSQTDSNYTKGNKDLLNTSAIDSQSSTRSQLSSNNSGNRGQSAIDSKISMRSQDNTNQNRTPPQDMSTSSMISDQPSMRSQNVNDSSPNSSMGTTPIDSSVSMRTVNDEKQNPSQT